MAFILINIGSNLGNRRLNLSRAMRAIGDAFGDFEMSHVVESQPWGFDSTSPFLNVGMAFLRKSCLAGFRKSNAPSPPLPTATGKADMQTASST